MFQIDNLIQDVDYIAKQLLEQGILPGDYYNSSFSEFQETLGAKSRKDRIQDPFALAAGLS